MHQGESLFLISERLNLADNHVVSFGPSLIFVLAVNRGGGVRALAKLAVIVSAVGRPHVEESNRVIVIGEPAVTGDGIIPFFSRFKERVPFLCKNTCKCFQ